MYNCPKCGKPLGDNEQCSCFADKPRKETPVWEIFLIVIIIISLIIIVPVILMNMLGYTTGSKTSNANSLAKSAVAAANCALTEFDEENIDVMSGRYILSSDPSYDRVLMQNGPRDNLKPMTIDMLRERISDYNYDDYNWIIVVENGVASYGAAANNWEKPFLDRPRVGSFPERAERKEGIPFDYYGNELTKSTTLRDIAESMRAIE